MENTIAEQLAQANRELCTAVLPAIRAYEERTGLQVNDIVVEHTMLPHPGRLHPEPDITRMFVKTDADNMQ